MVLSNDEVVELDSSRETTQSGNCKKIFDIGKDVKECTEISQKASTLSPNIVHELIPPNDMVASRSLGVNIKPITTVPMSFEFAKSFKESSMIAKAAIYFGLFLRYYEVNEKVDLPLLPVPDRLLSDLIVEFLAGFALRVFIKSNVPSSPRIRSWKVYSNCLFSSALNFIVRAHRNCRGSLMSLVPLVALVARANTANDVAQYLLLAGAPYLGHWLADLLVTIR